MEMEMPTLCANDKECAGEKGKIGTDRRTDGRIKGRWSRWMLFISEMSEAVLGVRASKGTSYWLLGRDDGSVEKVWKQSH